MRRFPSRRRKTYELARLACTPTQIKHALPPGLETTACGFFESLSAVLFSDIRVTACLSTDRDICTSGSPLSPFSRVSSYRYVNTSNLDFTSWSYIFRRHGISGRKLTWKWKRAVLPTLANRLLSRWCDSFLLRRMGAKALSKSIIKTTVVLDSKVNVPQIREISNRDLCRHVAR